MRCSSERKKESCKISTVISTDSLLQYFLLEQYSFFKFYFYYRKRLFFSLIVLSWPYSSMLSFQDELTGCSLLSGVIPHTLPALQPYLLNSLALLLFPYTCGISGKAFECMFQYLHKSFGFYGFSWYYHCSKECSSAAHLIIL